MILSANVVDNVYVGDSESGVVGYASQLSNDDNGGENRVEVNVNKVARVTKRMATRDTRAIIKVFDI